VGHFFNVTTYKKLVGLVSKYALQHIVVKIDKVKYVGFDKDHYGCTFRCTHGLTCVYELTFFGVGSMPLQSVYVNWTQLSFLDIVSDDCASELSIEKDFDVIMKCLNRLTLLLRLT